jgi:hypothetical protein
MTYTKPSIEEIRQAVKFHYERVFAPSFLIFNLKILGLLFAAMAVKTYIAHVVQDPKAAWWWSLVPAIGAAVIAYFLSKNYQLLLPTPSCRQEKEVQELFEAQLPPFDEPIFEELIGTLLDQEALQFMLVLERAQESVVLSRLTFIRKMWRYHKWRGNVDKDWDAYGHC